MRCFTRRWPIIDKRCMRAYLWMSLVHIQSECWKHPPCVGTHYCKLSVRRRKRSGAIPESRVLRCFHAPAASTWGFLLQDLSRDRTSELRGRRFSAWYGQSSVVFLFFPRDIPLLSGNVRVPAHLSAETPYWAVCHLPWITFNTQDVLLLLEKDIGTVLYTFINVLYTAEW